MAAYGIPQISTGDILRANIAKGTRPRHSWPKPSIDRASSSPTTRQPDGRRPPRRARHAAAATSSTAFPAPSTRPTGSMRNSPPTPRRLSPSSRSASSSTTSSSCTASPAAASRPPDASTTSTRIRPRSPGICDVDGSALVQRPDDTEAVFTERMKTFEAQTAPVIEHYRNWPLRRGQRRPARGSRSPPPSTQRSAAPSHAA